MGQDSVREHLRQIGASDRIVAGGLKGLVEAWDAVVNSVARGYSLDIDSYLNDLDTRQLLEEALSASPESEKQYYVKRVGRADRLMCVICKTTRLSKSETCSCSWAKRFCSSGGSFCLQDSKSLTRARYRLTHSAAFLS